VTFALHSGWAIQSAIGSEFKIDALYLSQDMKIVEKIEDLNLHYKTTILCTQDLHQLMSPKAQSTLRLIDCITMNESPTTPKVRKVHDLVC